MCMNTAMMLYMVGRWVGGWGAVRAAAVVLLLYLVHAGGYVGGWLTPFFSPVVVLQRCGSWPFVLLQ